MTREQLEFLISQQLDGVLPADERAALEARLVEDPEARKLYEEYAALHQAMKAGRVVPAVKWERLAEAISAGAADQQAAREGGEGSADEELELAIIRYIEDDMSDEERAALEKRFVEDASARRLLAEHRSLDTVLKHAWPMPHVDWERLGERLSENVSEEFASSVYSLSAWLRAASRVAMAACVLVGIGLGVYFAGSRSGGPVANNTNSNVIKPGLPVSVAMVSVGTPETAGGKAVVEIRMGPPEDAVREQYDAYSSGLVAMPSRVEVAEINHRWQEPGGLPY